VRLSLITSTRMTYAAPLAKPYAAEVSAPGRAGMTPAPRWLKSESRRSREQ